MAVTETPYSYCKPSIAPYKNSGLQLATRDFIINTGHTELADSAQGTALSQIKTIQVVIYITIDKKSRLQLITKSLVRMM